MNNKKILVEMLSKHNINPPFNVKQSNGYMRWGKNNRYWAKELKGVYVFGDFVDGSSYVEFPEDKAISAKKRRELTESHLKALREPQLKEWAEIAEKAFNLWESQPKAATCHPYLIEKKVDVGINVKIFVRHNSLIIPLMDTNRTLSTLQFIFPNGSKRFFSGGKKTGCFYCTRAMESNPKILCICEGYATGMTLDKIFNTPVIVCFDAGNLKAVAVNLRIEYPEAKIVIFADNDVENKTNTGFLKALKASQAVSNTRFLFPQILNKEGLPVNQSVDFNDAYCIVGEAILRTSIQETLNKRGECLVTIKTDIEQKQHDPIYHHNKTGELQ